MGHILAVDDKSGSDPKLRIGPVEVLLDGNGNVVMQMVDVHCRDSPQPRHVMVVENFPLGHAKAVSFGE